MYSILKCCSCNIKYTIPDSRQYSRMYSTLPPFHLCKLGLFHNNTNNYWIRRYFVMHCPQPRVGIQYVISQTAWFAHIHVYSTISVYCRISTLYQTVTLIQWCNLFIIPMHMKMSCTAKTIYNNTIIDVQSSLNVSLAFSSNVTPFNHARKTTTCK